MEEREEQCHLNKEGMAKGRMTPKKHKSIGIKTLSNWFDLEPDWAIKLERLVYHLIWIEPQSSDPTYSCWVDATVTSAGHEAKLKSWPAYMKMFSGKKGFYASLSRSCWTLTGLAWKFTAWYSWKYFHLKHNMSLHTSTSVMLTIKRLAVLTDIWRGSYSLKMRVVAGFH